MLRELRIQNFVLIEDLSLEFDPGFNVLSGETGAGKSIIVDALGLLLGERVKGEIIRSGAEEAILEAVFDSFDSRREKQIHQVLTEYGLEPDPEGLFIKRIIRPDGRGRCYLNSSPTQLKILEEIGNLLVDLHGQHEHQSLLHSEVYMDLLESYGGMENEAESVRNQFAEIRKISSEIQRLEESQRERNRLEDQLKFQIQEIEQAQIEPDEEDDLQRDLSKLKHAGQLAENATAIQTLLLEGFEERPAILDSLAEVQRRLQEMAQADPDIGSLERDLSTVLVQLQEAGREIASYGAKIEIDPARLEQIEERLHLLKNLKRKYGATLDEVLRFLDESHSRFSEIQKAGENLDELSTQREKAVRSFIDQAMALSQKRQKVAVRLSRAVTREMKELGMEQGQFLVQVNALGESATPLQLDGKNYRASFRGIDRVDFLVQTNPGMEPGPLKQIASGGEISRIALAIKTVLAEVDRVGSLIFDEIDSGIGGNIAEVVGKKFRKVSKDRQVLCVTHLPQIAGKAQRNFRVSKQTQGKKAVTQVERLEGEKRIAEIARMLGDESSKDTRAFAKKMIESD